MRKESRENPRPCISRTFHKILTFWMVSVCGAVDGCCGVWCGVWCVVCGVWCVVCGVWCVVCVWCGVVWCGVMWCGVALGGQGGRRGWVLGDGGEGEGRGYG